MGYISEADGEDEDMFVTLTLEDDTEEECRVLTIFEVDNQDYIAITPVDENGEDNAEGEVYIYRYFENSDGEGSLENIEDDEELDMVSQVFDKIMDEDYEYDYDSDIDSAFGQPGLEAQIDAVLDGKTISFDSDSYN